MGTEVSVVIEMEDGAFLLIRISKIGMEETAMLKRTGRETETERRAKGKESLFLREQGKKRGKGKENGKRNPCMRVNLEEVLMKESRSPEEGLLKKIARRKETKKETEK